MSDVREELADVMQRAYIDATNGSPFSGAIKYPIADAILSRFDVVEKPVVSAKELGRMARNASHKGSLVGAESRSEIVGLDVFAQLRKAGLMIVRTEDGER